MLSPPFCRDPFSEPSTDDNCGSSVRENTNQVRYKISGSATSDPNKVRLQLAYKSFDTYCFHSIAFYSKIVIFIC